MHAPHPSTLSPADNVGVAEHPGHQADATTGAQTGAHASAATDAGADTRIGALLQQAGKLTADHIERVVRAQHELGLRFGEVAIRLGLANQHDVDAAIARQFAFPIAVPGASALSPRLVAAFHPASSQGDTLRAVRSQLLLRWFSTGAHALAISGAGQGDASSVLAANLALVFAQLGQRTLLVDANLRRGLQHGLFGLHEQRASGSGSGAFDPVETHPSARDCLEPSLVPTGPLQHGPARNVSLQPAASQPAALQPNAAQLNAAQPNSAQPNSAQPDFQDPDFHDPGSSQPGPARPDLSRPSLLPHPLSQMSPSWSGRSQPGLADILAGRVGLDAIVPVPGFPALSLLTSGTVPPNPQELLERPSLGVLHAQLGRMYDVVLYDIAPTSHGAEALAMATHAGAALLVAQKDHTPLAALQRLAVQLTSAQVAVIGSVLVEAG